MVRVKSRILHCIAVLLVVLATVGWEPLDYGILQTVVTVSNTATPIPSANLAGRKSLIIKNLDSSKIVYLGSATVTADENSTGGHPLAYYENFVGDIGEDTIVYGIVVTGTAKVSIVEAR